MYVCMYVCMNVTLHRKTVNKVIICARHGPNTFACYLFDTLSVHIMQRKTRVGVACLCALSVNKVELYTLTSKTQFISLSLTPGRSLFLTRFDHLPTEKFSAFSLCTMKLADDLSPRLDFMQQILTQKL